MKQRAVCRQLSPQAAPVQLYPPQRRAAVAMPTEWFKKPPPRALLVAPLLFLAAGAAHAQTDAEAQAQLRADVEAVTNFSNGLVAKLYQALSPGRDNVVFSPWGLATSVALLLEAAEGDTAQEILTAFGLSSGAREQLRRGFKAYYDAFEHSAAVSAGPAAGTAAGTAAGEAAGAFNSALVRSAALLSPEFKTLLAKHYRANVTVVERFDNFTGVQPASLALELRTDTGVMSHWRAFQRLGAFSFLSARGAAAFERGGGRGAVAVPLVTQAGVLRAGRLPHLACSAAELPLEVGEVDLLLLVPDAPDAMDEVLVRLSGVRWARLAQWLSPAPRQVALPQMALLAAGTDLAPFLRQMGVRLALNASAADLSRATRAIGQPERQPSQRLFLKSLTQDAFFSTSFVAVNSVASVSANLVPLKAKRLTNATAEVAASTVTAPPRVGSGTVGTAGTVPTKTPSSSAGSESVTVPNHPQLRRRRQAAGAEEEVEALVVDRPFLFLLVHRRTKLVLLAGKAANPTQVP